ncbi:transglycosylase SLT domain-containing protein [Streptomyces sp. NPDC101118]|uniref:transglycosylase SLT domain-containing protein n=1 Tax=Streptomyces sp. NPDC101118 TaxID=3366109 RepID=UPI0037F6F5E5
MSASSTPGHSRLTKTHKMSIAGVSVLGAAALAFSLVPAQQADATTVAAEPVSWTQAVDAVHTKNVQGLTQQHQVVEKAVKAAEAKKIADAKAAAAKKTAAAKAAKAKKDAEAKAKAEAAAKKERAKKEAASRSAARKPVYANNLDGWIREALSIMKREGIPGSYAGIHRNIMRESSGNPRAINNWDINAQNGIPSKGLLQVIQPTFNAYHVKGTKFDLYDPVANIVAACNYAADRYGSMDNVNSAY